MSKQVDVAFLKLAALQYAVNVANGYTPVVGINPYGQGVCLIYRLNIVWEDLGPLIEEEGIELTRTADGWQATIIRKHDLKTIRAYAGAAITAVACCYVTSKLGPFVAIPEELQ